jgi:hypothetical protein
MLRARLAAARVAHALRVARGSADEVDAVYIV